MGSDTENIYIWISSGSSSLNHFVTVCALWLGALPFWNTPLHRRVIKLGVKRPLIPLCGRPTDHTFRAQAYSARVCQENVPHAIITRTFTLFCFHLSVLRFQHLIWITVHHNSGTVSLLANNSYNIKQVCCHGHCIDHHIQSNIGYWYPPQNLHTLHP